MLVAIAMNNDGYREILGITEGMKEDRSGWLQFLKYSEILEYGIVKENQRRHMGCINCYQIKSVNFK